MPILTVEGRLSPMGAFGVHFCSHSGGAEAILPVQELANPDTHTSADISIGPSYLQLLSALTGWFRSRGVPGEEGKDLAQETIVRTLIHLKRHGQRGDDLKPLAFTIARNLLTERARRGVGNVVTLTDDIDIADPSPSPLDTVMQREECSAVATALGTLGSRHRKVIELWMRGETPADIARSLGIKRNAADALLHRARRRLASILRESGEAFGAFLGVWGLRARRAASVLTRNDPSTIFAQAASAVAAVSIAGVLAMSGGASGASTGAHGGARAGAPSVASTSSTATTTVGRSVGSTSASTTSKTAGAPEVYANVAKPQAGVVTDVPDPKGGSQPIGIKFWKDGGGDSTHTESVIDTGTRTLCAHGCPTFGSGK
jgi:RNA polymerase sigma factor (sigma-70 family)